MASQRQDSLRQQKNLELKCMKISIKLVSMGGQPLAPIQSDSGILKPKMEAVKRGIWILI